MANRPLYSRTPSESDHWLKRPTVLGRLYTTSKTAVTDIFLRAPSYPGVKEGNDNSLKFARKPTVIFLLQNKMSFPYPGPEIRLRSPLLPPISLKRHQIEASVQALDRGARIWSHLLRKTVKALNCWAISPATDPVLLTSDQNADISHPPFIAADYEGLGPQWPLSLLTSN